MGGYIGPIPVPQGTQTRQSFTASASQTSFATAGYTVGFLDVYLNVYRFPTTESNLVLYHWVSFLVPAIS
jgi:hypothetical protein